MGHPPACGEKNRMKRTTITASLFLLTLICLATSASAEKWHFVQSPNYRMLISGDVNKARQALWRIEQYRQLFGMLLQREQVVSNAPLRIVGFANAQELAAAFPPSGEDDADEHSVYIRTETGDYAAIDLSSMPNGANVMAWPALARGMALRLLDGNYPRTPAWFDLGFAEYFSTVRFGNKETRVGVPPVRVMEALQDGEWIPSVKLLSADYTPSTEEEKLRYRAQAWLFLHFIYSDKRIEQVGDYFRLVMAERRPAGQAIQEAFQIAPDQLDKVMKTYRVNGAKDATPFSVIGTLTA